MFDGQFDICIIGSGIIALAIALNIPNQFKTLMICPPYMYRNSASYASGAMLTLSSEASLNETHQISKLNMDLRIEATGIYDEWLNVLNEFSGSRLKKVNGICMLNSNRFGTSAKNELEYTLKLADEYKLNYEKISMSEIFSSPKTTYANNPTQSEDEVYFLENESSINSGELLQSLHKAVSTKVQFDHTGLTNIEFLNKDIILSTKQNVHKVEKVVLANGAFIENLYKISPDLRSLGIVPIFGARGASAQLKNLAQQNPIYTIRAPNQDFGCGSHVIPQKDGLYVGATSRLQTMVPTINDHIAPTLDEIFSLIRDLKFGLSYNLEDRQLKNFNLGIRPLTSDKLPIVGPTLDERILVASGTYRNGMLLAPLVASITVDYLLGEKPNTRSFLLPTRKPIVSNENEMINLVCGVAESYLESTLSQTSKNQYTKLLEILSNLNNHPRERIALNKLWRRAPVMENIPNLASLIGEMH